MVSESSRAVLIRLLQASKRLAPPARNAGTGGTFGRWAWLCAVALVLAQAALFAWNLKREYDHALDSAYARLADAARIADENVSGSLRAIDLLLTDVASEFRRRGPDFDPATMTAYMKTRAEAVPEVRTVVVTTADGIVTAATRPDLIGWDLHERPYYARVHDAADRDHTFFSPLTQVVQSGTNVVFASRALPARDDRQWAGLVSASLEIRMFHALLATIRPNDPGSAVVMAGIDGRVVSRAPEPERFLGMDISKGGHFEKHMATESRLSFHRLVTVTDRVEKISAVRTIADGSYIVIVQQAVSDALAPWRDQAIDHGIGFILLSLAVLSLTGLAVRHHGREEQARHLISSERQARRESDRRSARTADLAARVFESSPDGIVITDHRHRILSANPAFLSMFHYVIPEMTGRPPGFLLSGTADRSRLRQALKVLRTGGVWEAEVIAVRKSGDIFPAWLRVSTDRTADGIPAHYIGIVSDMSEARSAQDRIEYLSRYDMLTALPNQRMLRDYFDMARCSTTQGGMALVCCNLDNFKHVNDTMGHALGDDLLREIAQRLKGCVAIGTGDIVSRNAGDEFLVLLVDVPTREAIHAAIYSMRAVVSVPVALGRHSVSVTASFGITRYPDDGETFDTLFQKADAAVFHAKQAGRNTSRYFEPSMIDYATERLTLKNDLQQAIERNEFVLHYQPLVDLASGRIIGAEALLRWQSPDHGFVSPSRFIPIAEETGLIVPIGQWVLCEVCRQGRQWRDAGISDLHLAVNISVIQLHSPDFVETVRQIIAESGFPSEWLELELTESGLISETGHTLDVINGLKKLGVSIAIDDFGTGYSCLAYLHRMKTDKLKIDRSFVTDLAADSESDAIVTTIIEMARTLNMTTLAEGVETEAQAALLRRYGCKEVQGYLFGRPIPADNFAQLIRG